MKKPREFWTIILNPINEVACHALVYFHEPVNETIQHLVSHSREVVPIDWDKVWTEYANRCVENDQWPLIQQLVERALKGEL